MPARAPMNSPDAVMLAIETSQRTGSVAVRVHGVIYSETLKSRSRHDDDLLPAIDRLLARCDVKPRELIAAAVSIGPGGFTGLRIAVATVKMFAETLNIRVAAVPSAMSAAHHHRGAGPIAVALAGKNNTFWFTRFLRDPAGAWKIEGEPAIEDPQSANINALTVLLADEYVPDTFRQRCDREGVSIIPPQFTAEGCLVAGDQMLRAGLAIDPMALSPLYARKPEAMLIWEDREKGASRKNLQ